MAVARMARVRFHPRCDRAMPAFGAKQLISLAICIVQQGSSDGSNFCISAREK